MRLRGKVALVTGAASGIGRATATLFAEEGASVFLTDVNEEAGQAATLIIREQGGSAIFLTADMSQESECYRVVEACVNVFGRVDTLVNNAGRIVMKGVEATSDDWQTVMATNVFGYAYMMRYAAEDMRKHGGGSIVNVASVSSVIAQAQMATYNASKGAVLQLTRCTALDLEPDHIRVNCVCPGLIWTGQVQKMAEEAGYTREQAEADFAKGQIMKRAAEPIEAAYPILFLASEESSFCTGSALYVDGGWTTQ
ncbi:MAG: SDR family NAD(P)-dependent oxidoreductase [Armatimonadetes bacterium]|nr:SDR family NAD(P)-dependent oxidoreductase [Armatimonadota bacterium]